MRAFKGAGKGCLLGIRFRNLKDDDDREDGEEEVVE
jgi:hypothetical protein